jgi:hypothetical protein
MKTVIEYLKVLVNAMQGINIFVGVGGGGGWVGGGDGCRGVLASDM